MFVSSLLRGHANLCVIPVLGHVLQRQVPKYSQYLPNLKPNYCSLLNDLFKHIQPQWGLYTVEHLKMYEEINSNLVN